MEHSTPSSDRFSWFLTNWSIVQFPDEFGENQIRWWSCQKIIIASRGWTFLKRRPPPPCCWPDSIFWTFNQKDIWMSGWKWKSASCTSSCRPTKKPHQLLASLKCGSPRRNKHQSVAIFAWLPLWLQSAAESTNRHPFWLSRTLPVKTKRNIIRALDDCTADRPVDCCD